ncbi:MAG: hypothetical protein JWN14_3901 [Chthonomonadales bacterium]|nr:hypothetical protein [Chthonomonadales bacterium]
MIRTVTVFPAPEAKLTCELPATLIATTSLAVAIKMNH